ncbi:MAG: twin-arginine translocase TatA/TatE family subunit [Bdellovibrionaceae bacterium]|jgi:sec-independent protein translocase protein TatA|nr:twin-arginine translocase TatA/TatE family subunit [Pseudobdellovibrionaceae bacterium]
MSPSIWQILIVLVIILLLFGPKRIPGLGKSLGEAIRGFKKGINEDDIDVTDSVKTEQLDSSEDEKTNKKKENVTEKESH